MIRRWSYLPVLFFIALTFIYGSPSFAAEKRAAPAKLTPRAEDLKLTLRDLWSDHIFWIRSFVFATKSGSADAAKVANEMVMQNSRAISSAIGSQYGEDNGYKFNVMLSGHYEGIKDYMKAVFAGDAAGKGAAADRLSRNVDGIAAFLSSANPNLKKITLVSLLSAHIGHHMSQIDAVAANDFPTEAMIRESMKSNIYIISDALADAIVKQFPKRF